MKRQILVNKNIFSEKWFRELPLEVQHLYFYILHSCEPSGIMELRPVLAHEDAKIKPNDLEAAIAYLCENRVIVKGVDNFILKLNHWKEVVKDHKGPSARIDAQNRLKFNNPAHKNIYLSMLEHEDKFNSQAGVFKSNFQLLYDAVDNTSPSEECQ